MAELSSQSENPLSQRPTLTICYYMKVCRRGIMVVASIGG